MPDRTEQSMINRIKAALLLWYPFKADATVLLVADEGDEIGDVLAEKITHLKTATPSTIPLEGQYDHVICLHLPEQEENPVEFLMKCRACLKASGTLLFPMHNRIGIRYFCGDRDPYTGGVFDGIENYIHADLSGHAFAGREFTAKEMERFFSDAGFDAFQFYSVYAGLEYPLHLMAEGYLPNEDLANRVIPIYHDPQTVFLEEERLYATLAENGLLHKMANAYLVECAADAALLSDSLYITSSFERSKENAMITILQNDGTIAKKALYDEGVKRLSNLQKNHAELNARGVCAVDITVSGSEASMPYLDYPTVQKHWQELLVRDKDAFLREVDRFMEAIDRSADIVSIDDTYGPIAKKAFIDMVPLNCLYVDGEFVFIDQEFAPENYPINVVKARVMLTFFSKHDELRFIEQELYERYGLTEGRWLFREKEHAFLHELWSEDRLGTYRNKMCRDLETVGQNRMRINRPTD